MARVDFLDGPDGGAVNWTWPTEPVTVPTPSGTTWGTHPPAPPTPTPTAPGTTTPTWTTMGSGSGTNAFGFPSMTDLVNRARARTNTTPTPPPTPTNAAGPSPWSSGSGTSFRDWFMGLAGSAPAYNQDFLLGLESLLQQSGSRLTPANAAGERTKIWDPSINDWVRVGFGEGTPVWIPQGWGAHGPGTSGWNDPSTAALDAYLQQYLGELDAQRTRQAGSNEDLRRRQAEAQAATERLVAFMTQRAQQLQGPAYTGAEAEVLRTQALDPIERDRQASRQRALQNIGARGLDPSSGIAQELLNQVDAGFDRSRAGAQNTLAYRQIAEERSRQQEAQALLAAIPQAQRAAAQGDLAFLQALDAALNNYRNQGVNLATQSQRLPSLALNDALSALGMGGNPASIFQQMAQMYGMQQNQGQDWWSALGAILPFILGGGR